MTSRRILHEVSKFERLKRRLKKKQKQKQEIQWFKDECGIYFTLETNFFTLVLRNRENINVKPLNLIALAYWTFRKKY